MDAVFTVLTMLGALALFLFGMNYMSSSLERRAGNKLKTILGAFTDNPVKGFLLGTAVTAIVQSSSATTVMVVGFVNSGVMTLNQVVNIIIGANVGAAITAWITALSGIQGTSFVLQLLKPSSFTPIIALIGLFMYLSKKQKQHDTGCIFLGFAVLMFGMETMSDAVAPLAKMPGFSDVMLMFSNPILGVLIGLGVTCIIQSSSASIGILQALSMTGALNYGTAIPIIMGLNIGTCATAMLSSIGASPDARRTALIHLYYNIIGTIVFLALFEIVKAVVPMAFLSDAINTFGIALVHTIFKILCTLLIMPMRDLLVKLAVKSVPEKKKGKKHELTILDERLFVTPAVAVAQADRAVHMMAETAEDAILRSFTLLRDYNEADAARVEELEGRLDEYEDKIGTYLVKLSSQNMAYTESREVAKLLNLIGNFERIGDHAMSITYSATELHEKKLGFSAKATNELAVLERALRDILRMALDAFERGDMEKAFNVEPLEQVIDKLSADIRSRHVQRLTSGECTIEMGFVLSDVLGDFERISDHCSNIAACVIEIEQNSMEVHEYTNEIKNGGGERFSKAFRKYQLDYALAAEEKA